MGVAGSNPATPTRYPLVAPNFYKHLQLLPPGAPTAAALELGARNAVLGPSSMRTFCADVTRVPPPPQTKFFAPRGAVIENAGGEATGVPCRYAAAASSASFLRA